MANLTDTSYYLRSIKLPLDECKDLTLYITKYEKEVLIKSLGYEMYGELISGLALPTPAQKWLYLRDGVDYRDGTELKRWNGLINAEKESLIPYYVFYYYTKYSSYFSSGNGAKLLKSENSENVSFIGKQTDAYNSYLDLRKSLDDFIVWSNDQDASLYPNYLPEKIESKVNIFNI